jgi:uncharacterized protein (TIGR03083 family)
MSASDLVSQRRAQADAVGTALAEYLAALPAAAWAGPSDCAGWSVANVVAHLITVQELLGGSVSRGLQGDSGPPPEATDGIEAWRALRARQVVELGALPPAELLARFRQHLATMQDVLGRLAAAQPSSGLGWFARGAQPLTWFPGQWFVELAFHDWDIRVARDPQADVLAAAAAGLGAEMRPRMERCFKPDLAGGLDGVVRISLGGPAPTAWLARLADGKLDDLDDGAVPAAATIETEPGPYALVQTGRRPAEHFAAAGRWRVSGNAALANGLIAALGGY